MRLTTKNITPYLLDKGFLSTSTLMNGQYTLAQTQSRNCIFQITTGTDTGLFVKQLAQMDPQNVYLMQKDATMHHLLHQAEFFAPLKSYVPHYYGYDPNQHVLVVENFPQAQNLFEVYLAEQKLSAEDAVEIANILALLHQDITEAIDTNRSLQFFNRDMPWILKITELDFQNEPVLQLAQNDDFLRTQIAELAQSWEGNCIQHGDVKLVNFLKITKNNQAEIKLIDWEIANIGDPLWDIAGFFQSYLSFWVLNQPSPSGKVQPNSNPKLWNLKDCQSCISAFWKQYVQQKGWDEAKAKTKLEKATKLTAIRMLQTAKEFNFQTPTQLQETAVKIVQVAQNILKSPDKAIVDLLGIKGFRK